MPCTRSEPHLARGIAPRRLASTARQVIRTAGLAIALWAAGGCAFVPSPARARPTLPLVIDAHTARSIIAAPESTALESTSPGRWRGQLCGEGETVQFELWRPPGSTRPMVVLVPILAGGAELMEQVGRLMQERGFDVAFCARAGSALVPPQRGADLQELFRRTVLHQRLLLAWLREPAHEPPPAVFVLGMSLGGIVATAVAALEPDLDGLAICLSGGDLGSLVTDSSEHRVQRWVAWRHQNDGIGRDTLQWELHRELAFEPIAMAPAIATGKVLFVSAWFDTVIPRRNQDLLWEALGRPARLTVPLGHYTAALAIEPILSAAAEHFRSHLPAAAAPPR